MDQESVAVAQVKLTTVQEYNQING